MELQPQAVQLPQLPPVARIPRSVAERTEQQAAPGVEVTYFSLLHDPEVDQAPEVVGSWRRKLSSTEWTHETPHGSERLRRAGIFREASSRCGFTWDDAAAKVGPPCTKSAECRRPRDSFGNASQGIPAPWPLNQSYSCFKDLPNYGRAGPGECFSKNMLRKSDVWCNSMCTQPWFKCDLSACACTDEGGAWNLSAPIQPHDDTPSPEDLPVRSVELKKEVIKEWRAAPSGLPPCRWRPKRGCTNETQYECVKGHSTGECSGANWFGSDTCEISCVHVSLLNPVPYYALWRSGVQARPHIQHQRHPRYKHAADQLTPAKRGIHLSESNVLMSRFCRSEANQFVGVSLYSPKYEADATRLVRSCERVGVCCKAMQLSSDAFGPEAPEGSEAFRFQVISMKPSFIWEQIEATALPVVYLDTDLEFRTFPELFQRGSWPKYDRDVALFNFWANETRLDTKDRPQIGSAVAYFNTTRRARKVLEAWAQAMAYGPNQRAPDDQVLDTLLTEGGWLHRASYGWLPTGYLRLMPSFYRGVDPVIEHDHGSPPGLLKHSEAKPKLPPVVGYELSEPDDPAEKGRKLEVTEAEMTAEVKRDEWVSYNCFYNKKCPPLADGSTMPAQMAPGAYRPGDPQSCVTVSKFVTTDWCKQVCVGKCPTAMCRCDFATFDWPTDVADETIAVPEAGSPMQLKPQPPAAKPPKPKPAVCKAVRPGVGDAWCDKTCINTPAIDFCSGSCHCPGWNATAY